MLDIIASGFKKAKDTLRGVTELTENNIAEALESIRTSLLEGDVEYSVCKTFIQRVKEKAIGEEVRLRAGKGAQKMKVSAGDHFVRICKEELEALMGGGKVELSFPRNPTVIMMVGLQGTGKTTTTGKLAKFLCERKKRKPLLVAADIYRPAAAEQLAVLGKKIGVPVFHIEGATPLTICREAKKKAALEGYDTLLFDTAGRLTIDEKLMTELFDIKKETHPDHILLVCDAMMGQDAVTTAKAFHDKLDISGFIMTKLDGDARGGAALSIKEVTGRPIKFLGMGEELDRLEEFRPEGLASRILGLGDVVGLMEDFERVVEDDAEEDAMRMLSGQFNFKDFYKQISMIQKMGSLKDLIAKMPMQNMIPKDINIDDRELTKIKSIIDSMTEKERLMPSLIDVSRARRIALGCGRNLADVNDLIKKFKTMRNMMGQMSKNLGFLGKIPGLGSKFGGGMPDPASLMGLSGMSKPQAAPRPVDRDKLKKLRKASRNNRKKNRK